MYERRYPERLAAVYMRFPNTQHLDDRQDRLEEQQLLLNYAITTLRMPRGQILLVEDQGLTRTPEGSRTDFADLLELVRNQQLEYVLDSGQRPITRNRGDWERFFEAMALTDTRLYRGGQMYDSNDFAQGFKALPSFDRPGRRKIGL